jgi:hypothetical protein
MSSDAFADLGGTAGVVADGLIRMVDVNKRPAAGSPCDKESDGEPFAGEWSAHPARDLVATLRMECWSCADHLRVAGGVLAGHRGIASLYTLTRGATEAGAIACYLSDPGIDPLERVRRLMNHNLAALHEDLNMLGRFGGRRRQDGAAPPPGSGYRARRLSIRRCLHTTEERIHGLLPR